MVTDDDVDPIDTPGDDLRDVLGMPARRAPAVLARGQIIDEAYRIEEEIGAGGMGRVYRAHDLRLSRDVAVKLHGFALAPDDDTLRREATALARLTHPNVVTVYEVGTWNGHPWVAMAYVPGGTVRTWLKAAPRTARAILTLFIEAGRGLEAAHAAGLVHRDFKPDNVLVGDDGRICVADFGLARDANVAESHVGDIVGSPATPLSSHTKTGAVRGTPAYMAPEQRDGTRVDASADQFAFAVSLWEALAGARPFGEDGKTLIAPPSGSMPRHVEVALRRALSIAPAERWPSMTVLLDELARDPARTRFTIAVSVIVMIALVGGGFVIAKRTQSSEPLALACDASRELDGTWSPAARDKILAAYPGEIGTRVTASIAAWAEGWLHQRAATCRAKRTDSAATVAARDACLDRAHSQLVATLDVLATEVTSIEALTLSTALPRLADCADAAPGVGPLPISPHDILSTQAAESMMAKAHAWMNVGKFPLAVVVAREALALTEKLGRPGLTARAQATYAGALDLVDEHEGVLDRYEKAVQLAAEAHDDVLVADIYLAMLQLVTRLEKQGEIDRMLSVTTTAIERANRPPALAERLLAKRADIAMRREDFETALKLYEQVVPAYTARYGEDQDLARTLTSLGSVYARFHRLADARTVLQRAISIMRKVYGDLHPNIGVIYSGLGNVEVDAGNYDEAVAAFKKSIEIKEKILGPESRGLSAPLMNLSAILTRQGDIAGAIATARRALAIMEKTLPPKHPSLALVLTNLGDALFVHGDIEESVAVIDRAVAIFPPDSTDPGVTDPLRSQARNRERQGNLKAARAALSRALTITTALDPNSVDTARIRVELAQIERDPAAFDAGLELLAKGLGDEHPEVAKVRAMGAQTFGPTKSKPR